MATPVPAPRLRGREAQLRALGDAVERVASGHPAVVVVEGEAGIGKTRLLAETLAGARARGLQVAAGRAQELERTRPFGVLADALACTPITRSAAAGDRVPAHHPGRRPRAADRQQRPRPPVPGRRRLR